MYFPNIMTSYKHYQHDWKVNQYQQLNIRLLLTLALTLSVRVSQSHGCNVNKDFERASQLYENQDTAPYVRAFFEHQTCFIHPQIHDTRECYVYCNSWKRERISGLA